MDKREVLAVLQLARDVLVTVVGNVDDLSANSALAIGGALGALDAARQQVSRDIARKVGS